MTLTTTLPASRQCPTSLLGGVKNHLRLLRGFPGGEDEAVALLCRQNATGNCSWSRDRETLVAMSFLDGSDTSEGEGEEVAISSNKGLHGIGSSSKAKDNDTLQVNEQFAKRWDTAIRTTHLPERVRVRARHQRSPFVDTTSTDYSSNILV